MLRIFRTESFSPFRISNVYTTRNHFQLSRRRIRFVGIGERKEGEKRVARAGVLNSYENPNSICNNPDWVFTRSLRSVYKNAIFGRMRSLKDRRGFTRLENISIFWFDTSTQDAHRFRRIDSHLRAVILQSKSFETVDIGSFHLREREENLWNATPFTTTRRIYLRLRYFRELSWACRTV